MKEKTDFIMAREEILQSKLKEAQDNAPTIDYVESIFGERQRFRMMPVTEEVKQKLCEIEKEIDKFMVFVETLVDFKCLLYLTGEDEEYLIDSLEHENAHGNKADAIGCIHKGYSLSVGEEKGKFYYLPQALTKVPESFGENEQQRIEARIKILEAPEEYGNRLSPGDKEEIVILKKRLEETKTPTS